MGQLFSQYFIVLVDIGVGLHVEVLLDIAVV
jgi:hypothetical protein